MSNKPAYLDTDGTRRRKLARETADEFADAGILALCEECSSDEPAEVYHPTDEFEWLNEWEGRRDDLERMLDDIEEGRATAGQIISAGER